MKNDTAAKKPIVIIFALALLLGLFSALPAPATASGEVLKTLPVANPYKAAQKLQASLADYNKVELSWEAPFTEGFFGYCKQATVENAYSATGIMAVRFEQDDLIHLLGTKLTRVDFATRFGVTVANTAYTLLIYAGGDGNAPGREVHRQPVIFSNGGGWHTVTLTTPVEIDVYEELWICMEVQALSTGGMIYRMSADLGPAVQGKGNLMFFNGAWTTLSAFGFDCNWAIRGYAEPAGDPQVQDVPEQYMIKRNGGEIAVVPGDTLTYEDALSITGSYTYSITALYDGGTGISDPIYAGIEFVNECDAKPENLTATLEGNKVMLEWEFTPVVTIEKALFGEGFAVGIPGAWGNVDNDGDGI